MVCSFIPRLPSSAVNKKYQTLRCFYFFGNENIEPISLVISVYNIFKKNKFIIHD